MCREQSGRRQQLAHEAARAASQLQPQKVAGCDVGPQPSVTSLQMRSLKHQVEMCVKHLL